MQEDEKKIIDLEDIHAFNEDKDRTGIVYLSRVPPMMGPQEVRNFLQPFGEITRLYLTPADKGKTGGKPKGNQAPQKKRGMFVDGWVEFRKKRCAKDAALALNGTPVGGKRTSKYYGELWAIKYLTKFKWSHLTEQIELEKATRQQKLQTEISQAKREASFYLKQAEKAETASKIEAKRAARRAAEDSEQVPAAGDRDVELDNLKKRFRQRKPVAPKN